MKKSAFILLLILLLFASCKTKEERLIIGEWKLVDVKKTLETVTREPPWADYLNDDSKSLTITFNKKKMSIYDTAYELTKKDGLNSDIETGYYVIKNSGVLTETDLLLLIGQSKSYDFYIVTLEKQNLILKEYLIDGVHSFPPPNYITYIFKKIK